MGFNQIKAKSVPRRSDFVKAKKSVIVTTVSGSDSSNDVIYEAGESLVIGDIVRIFTDSKAYKSTAKYSDNLYGQYFVVQIAVTGSDAVLRRYGQINVTTTLTVNLPIYLTTGTPNFTQTIPTKTAEIDLLQYVGYASDVNTIVIDIKLAKQYD